MTTAQPRAVLPRCVGLALAGALVLTACGLDDGVTAVDARPTPIGAAPQETPATTVDAPPGADVTATTEPVATTEPPVDVTTTEPVTTEPGPSDPAIVEPELFVDLDIADVIDVGGGKPPRDHDELVAVAFTDIERWWGEVYPEVYGSAFEPLEGGAYAGYPDRTTEVPGCGEPRTAYEELQLFVAFYCQFGDFMAYDDGDGPDSLLTPLAQEFGSAVLGVVLAHEYGHAIQARIGALDRNLATIRTEQQADCFAGAWTGQAYRGESTLLRLGDTDVRAGLLAMLTVRDPVGTSQFVPGGHGSAFDRVGAFQEGFLSGPQRCAELLAAPLDLMPNEFQPGSLDQILGGNAPYDCSELDPAVVGQDIVDSCTPAPVFLAEDLDDFWQTAIGTEFGSVTAIPVGSLDAVPCGDVLRLSPEVAVCPGERALYYDEPSVLADYREFGDFSLGYFYGIGWAEFAQRALESDLTGEERALLSDCFTGAWVRDITPDAQGRTPRSRDRDGDGIEDGVQSSPGDLDEAIRMAIKVGDLGVNVDVVGSPFEKIEAFRAGVLGGLDACAARL